MADCRKSFRIHVLIDADSGRVGTFDEPLETRVLYLPQRWRRHGKKGRRPNKRDRAPRHYPSQWWDWR